MAEAADSKASPVAEVSHFMLVVAAAQEEEAEEGRLEEVRSLVPAPLSNDNQTPVGTTRLPLATTTARSRATTTTTKMTRPAGRRMEMTTKTLIIPELGVQENQPRTAVVAGMTTDDDTGQDMIITTITSTTLLQKETRLA